MDALRVILSAVVYCDDGLTQKLPGSVNPLTNYWGCFPIVLMESSRCHCS